ALDVMTTLNKAAAEQALTAGIRAATDVTGFGLLGHLYKMLRASGVGAVLDSAAVPLVEGAADALRDGYVSGGTRRTLEWVCARVEIGRASCREGAWAGAGGARTTGGR